MDLFIIIIVDVFTSVKIKIFFMCVERLLTFILSLQEWILIVARNTAAFSTFLSFQQCWICLSSCLVCPIGKLLTSFIVPMNTTFFQISSLLITELNTFYFMKLTFNMYIEGWPSVILVN